MTMHSAATEGKQAPLSWINVAFFGTIHALPVSSWFFSWSALGVTIFLHWLFGSIPWVSPTFESSQLSSAKVVGICDRYFGSTCSSRRDNLWVAGHRLHHAYTEDEDKDPIPPSVVFGGAICSGFCTHVQSF